MTDDPMMQPVGEAPATAATVPNGARSRRRVAFEEAVLPAVVALLIAAVVGDVLILSFGQSPSAVYKLLLDGTWGNAYGFGQVLYKATTLTFTGLAVGLGLRAGLFNIGAESQLAAHEVITTIMLNFVVLALLNYLVSAKLHVPDTLHTPELRSGALPRLADAFAPFHGSAANATILLAVATAIALGWYLFRTRRGFELRSVGLQPAAAEFGGVSVAGVTWRALTVSGAIAGLGGLNYVLGYKHYYEEGFATGAGFLGIAVALVGRSHPTGIVLAALLFATLSQGGLAVNALVPKQMVDVLQAVVILAVATSVPEVRRLLRSASAGATR